MSDSSEQSSSTNGGWIPGRKIAEYVFISISALVAVAAQNWVGNNLPWFLQALLQLSVFISLVIVFHLLSLGLKTIPTYREWFDKRARFEGLWFEVFYSDHEIGNDGSLNLPDVEVEDETGGCHSAQDDVNPRYATFFIEYTGPISDSYRMFGTAYYPNGLYYSFWTSRSLMFFPRENRVEYLFTGNYNSSSGNIRGVGSLNFRRRIVDFPNRADRQHRLLNKKTSTLHSGLGYFVESSEKPERRSVEFIRLTHEEVDHLVPDRKIMHPAAAMRKFVMEYHQLLGKKLKGGLRDPVYPSTRIRSDFGQDKT